MSDLRDFNIENKKIDFQINSCDKSLNYGHIVYWNFNLKNENVNPNSELDLGIISDLHKSIKVSDSLLEVLTLNYLDSVENGIRLGYKNSFNKKSDFLTNLRRLLSGMRSKNNFANQYTERATSVLYRIRKYKSIKKALSSVNKYVGHFDLATNALNLSSRISRGDIIGSIESIIDLGAVEQIAKRTIPILLKSTEFAAESNVLVSTFIISYDITSFLDAQFDFSGKLANWIYDVHNEHEHFEQKENDTIEYKLPDWKYYSSQYGYPIQ